MSEVPAAWHPDPKNRHQYRYWNGESWTDDVADNGLVGRDPWFDPPPQAGGPVAGFGPPAQQISQVPAAATTAGDVHSRQLAALLDACMSGRIQESVADLFDLTEARPASVAPARSIWSKFDAFIGAARSTGNQLTAVKMSQFAIFWHDSAAAESDDTVRFYLGSASADQLRSIRLGALACCRDLDPSTVVIPPDAGGDTAGELVLCEIIALGVEP
jgi:hypothetical protein